MSNIARNKKIFFLSIFILMFIILYNSPNDDRYPPAIYKSSLVQEVSVEMPQGSFTDNRGSYERHKFGREGNHSIYTNLVYTRKGHMRSGDLHKCEQVNFMIWGRAKLTQLIRGEERETMLHQGDVAVIPPHIPHLYFFEEDTLMTEIWRQKQTHLPCSFKAWYYKPFRDRIPTETLKHP